MRFTPICASINACAFFNAATDLQGRPLFVDAVYEDTALQGGKLLGRRALYAQEIGVDPIVGYAGDWSKAVWGAVGGGSGCCFGRGWGNAVLARVSTG